MSHCTRQSAFVLLGLLAAFSLPGVAAGAVFCDKDLTGVRLSDQGRVEIRVEQAGGHPLGTLLQICNIEEPMGTIDPLPCQRLYSQLLAAFHTDTPVSLHFRDAVLDQQELWEGNCESLTHQGDFSSALVTIESRK